MTEILNLTEIARAEARKKEVLMVSEDFNEDLTEKFKRKNMYPSLEEKKTGLGWDGED